MSSSSSIGQTSAALLRLAAAAGEVHRGQRRGAVGQALADARAGGQELGDLREAVPGALHEREDLRRGDAVGCRVVGDRLALPGAIRGLDGAGGRGRVMGDAEAAAAVRLAVQQQARPRRVALDQPWLVEEGGAHRPGRVEHAGLDQRAHPPAPDGPRGDAAHLHRHGRLLARAPAPTRFSPRGCRQADAPAARRRWPGRASAVRPRHACRAAPAGSAGARGAASGRARRSSAVGSAARRRRTRRGPGRPRLCSSAQPTPAAVVLSPASGPIMIAAAVVKTPGPSAHRARGGRPPGYSAASSHQ